MSARGRLFILSGPAGAGKGTLRKGLFDAISGLVYSVSCTTRQMRPGEVNGRDYRFVTKERFNVMIADDAFLEWAEVHKNLYGTMRDDVEEHLSQGEDVVLEIDVEGCRSVKERLPDAVSIFITVPSLDCLEERLDDRGTETPEERAVRLRNAAREMMMAREYEHVIVNDDLETALAELIRIVESYRTA